jgi:hypothetical protein
VELRAPFARIIYIVRSPWIVSLALVAACGAKLGGDPAVTGGADAPPGSPVDAPSGTPVDAPLAPIDAPPDARACTGGSDVEGHCYLYHSDALAWAAAGSACAADGTHLAIIDDAVQNAAVKSIIGVTSPAFIGASDLQSPGSKAYYWVDGTAVGSATYSNFNAGEPNDANGVEDCLVMRVDGGSAGQWDDRPCVTEPANVTTTAGTYPYVCEF